MVIQVSEKEIESQILQWLNLQTGIYAFKINTVGVFDSTRMVYRTNKNPYIVKGCSDILLIIDGKMGAIEVKTPKAKKRALLLKEERDLQQRHFLDKIKNQGGHSLLASSLDEVITWIKEIRSVNSNKII